MSLQNFAAVHCNFDTMSLNNYLFHGKGKVPEERNWMLYEENGCVRCKLPDSWSCLYDQHGDGSSIRFPVKMRKLFTQSLGSMMLLLRPQELTMKIKFIKITASCSRV